VDEIKKYFELSDVQARQFEQLFDLYCDWNTKINVISRKDIHNLYERHVLHSLSIAKFVSFRDGSRILDVGSGGGFPGLPLAILFPGSNFVLVDSIGKKLQVVSAIADEIGLRNIETRHKRIEDEVEQFDFVTMRAVTRLNTAWSWVNKNIDSNSRHEIKNGLLYLKGGDVSAELPIEVNTIQIPINRWFSEPFFEDKALVYLSDK
jgi:16S rRNA (guanine527-N7)-methyltransferase